MNFVEIWTSFGTWFQQYCWPFLNTNFISSLFPTIVGLMLTRRVAEVAEAARDDGVIRTAHAQFQPKSEDEPLELKKRVGQSETEDDDVEWLDDVFDELAQIIKLVKDGIENKIENLEGRRKRKYDRVARHDYRPIIAMLSTDGAYSPEQAEDLIDIFESWSPYSRRKPETIPTKLANQIRNHPIE